MRPRGKRASERRIKGWKAEREISDEEIESIFKNKKNRKKFKKKGKKFKKKQEKKEIRGPILFSIIDHFSKYGWIYCIPNKSMDTVFLKIKQAFAQFMPPKILHTDNVAQKDKFNLEHSIADFLCIIIKECTLLLITLQLK